MSSDLFRRLADSLAGLSDSLRRVDAATDRWGVKKWLSTLSAEAQRIGVTLGPESELTKHYEAGLSVREAMGEYELPKRDRAKADSEGKGIAP